MLELIFHVLLVLMEIMLVGLEGFSLYLAFEPLSCQSPGPIEKQLGMAGMQLIGLVLFSNQGC